MLLPWLDIPTSSSVIERGGKFGLFLFRLLVCPSMLDGADI